MSNRRSRVRAPCVVLGNSLFLVRLRDNHGYAFCAKGREMLLIERQQRCHFRMEGARGNDGIIRLSSDYALSRRLPQKGLIGFSVEHGDFCCTDEITVEQSKRVSG